MKLMNSIHKYDIFVFNWLTNVRIHATLAKLGRYISKTADGPLYALCLIVVGGYGGYQSTLFLAIVLAFIIERPIYFILKNGFRRNRPETALKNFTSIITPSDQFSFPSGHTSAAFLMATLIGYFFPPLTLPLFCWAVLVGFSRIVLGVHFSTDILVGAVLGTSIAMFSLELVTR